MMNKLPTLRHGNLDNRAQEYEMKSSDLDE